MSEPMLTVRDLRMGRETDVSFIVVTYNSSKTIERCLKSILAQQYVRKDLIVVDNASSDSTVKLVQSRVPEARIFCNAENKGYGAANNLGANKALGASLAFVNPDVELSPTWSHTLLDAMNRHAEVGAAEGKLFLSSPLGAINCRGSFLNYIGYGCPTGFGKPDIEREKSKLVSYPSGAAFMTKREAYQQIGGFDEGYFLYHEDVDLGVRLYDAGWTVLYVPEAVATHHFDANMRPEKIRYLESNRWRTLAKNMPMDYFIRCGPLLLVAEAGVFLYLGRKGLLDAKMRATARFFEMLGEIRRIRKRRVRRFGKIRYPQRFPFAAEIPWVLGDDGLTFRLAARLQQKYSNAFFSSLPS